MHRRTSDPVRILFVGTGDVSRSPFAALHTRFLLEARLGPPAHRFTITSAGVGAAVGSGMHPASRDQLADRRHHPAAEHFRARVLSADEVAVADLVLTMTRHQRSRVLSAVPSARPRTFTLRELARLADAVAPDTLPLDPPARLRALVTTASAARATYGPVPVEDDAVPDPIGGAEAHATAARVVDAAVRRVLAVVVPGPACRAPDAPTPPPTGSGTVFVPAPRPSPERRPFVALTARPRPV